MWLHVSMFGAKQLPGALASQLLHLIGELAAAVIALAGIAFRVFVGEHRAHGFEHGFADKILRGDQLQSFMLAADFVVNGGGNLWINFTERAGHGIGFHNNSQHLAISSGFRWRGTRINRSTMNIRMPLRRFYRLEAELGIPGHGHRVANHPRETTMP